ncbi:Ig-like domain-containing protein, partial [Shewanella sp. 10N.286.45.A1]|uniref:Ig-like domain-containing protein n=1 Tax=Shewanella sp. 10N.286.45.A1 TaxID=3229694 RepID=UPI0035536CAC
ATVTITVNDVNDAPETADLTASGDEDATSIAIPQLSGSDSDGTIASFVIDTLPANGTLYLNGQVIAAGTTVSVADAANLTFVPTADWNGDTRFTYHAVDNDGLADATPATVTIT